MLRPQISRIPRLLPGFAIGKTAFTANSVSSLVFGARTLMVGSVITYSSTVLPLLPNGGALSIGGTSMC
jgi:hypothetical protein